MSRKFLGLYQSGEDSGSHKMAARYMAGSPDEARQRFEEYRPKSYELVSVVEQTPTDMVSRSGALMTQEDCEPFMGSVTDLDRSSKSTTESERPANKRNGPVLAVILDLCGWAFLLFWGWLFLRAGASWNDLVRMAFDTSMFGLPAAGLLLIGISRIITYLHQIAENTAANSPSR